MSIKQDKTATRTSEDLRRRLNVGEIVETGKKVDASVEQVQKLSNQVTNLSNQVTGLNNSVTNTRESYVSTNAQDFTEEQKERVRDNIGAGDSSFSGSYNDLKNKPTIPTKTSQLENDVGFITDSGSITPINVVNENSDSTEDTYSCDYVNNLVSETTLYENSNGTNGTVPLSETASNFKYLEIFYKNNDGYHSSCKVDTPNGKNVSLMACTLSDSLMWQQWSTCNINETSITRNYGKLIRFSNPAVDYLDTSDLIYITKVIGYK